MANGNVTRSVVFARAYAWQFDGKNPDGTPKMVKVGGVDFKSTKPTVKEAYRALKRAGYEVRTSEFCMFEEVETKVISMDLDTFCTYGVEVDRLPNGRVKAIEGTEE